MESEEQSGREAERQLKRSADELEGRIEELDEQIREVEGKAADHRRHAGMEPIRPDDAEPVEQEDEDEDEASR